ncbi:MAG: carboxymuconolactone decarboxylase family protein [Myxococcota bacterium]
MAVLTEQERRLISLFAAAVGGDWDRLRRLRADAGPNEPDRAWRETMLMVHLFAGFPRQVEAYGVLAAAGGLGVPDPSEVENVGDLPERGQPLFDTIYGQQSQRVQDILQKGHPNALQWIVGHAYGRVLTRPGLTSRQRELLAVTALAVLGQERQLASHVRGAVRCGATRDDVLEVIEQVAPAFDEEKKKDFHAIIDKFASPGGD